jgi:hypothetical protein
VFGLWQPLSPKWRANSHLLKWNRGHCYGIVFLSLQAAQGKVLISNFILFYFLWASFCEWCGFEVILMGWKSIHEKTQEISRWNKVHSRNTIYTLISSMKCSWFAILVFALKIIQISWMNMHKTVVVNFHGGDGWKFIHEIKVARGDILWL